MKLLIANKKRSHKSLCYGVIPFCVLATLACILQFKMFLSGDVGYLLYIANKLLSGGTYGRDFLETNPPMILYLYLPVCIFAKWTSVNIVVAMKVYVLLLAIFSSILCWRLIKQIVPATNQILTYFLSYMVVLVLLFLPAAAFGQREHILTIFIMPYLFSAVLALENKRISPVLALIIGLFAGLGFALKPFFLVTLVLIELYFICFRRRLWGWVRIESITIAIVLVLYVLSIFLFQPNYISVVLPIVSKFYFIGTEEGWSDLVVKRPYVIFCLWMAGSYFFYKNDRTPVLSTVIWLALLGMIAAFMIPRSSWFYHAIPAISLACLLLALYAGQFVSFVGITKKSILFFLVVSASIFYVPVSGSYYIFNTFVVDKEHGAMQKLITYINHIPGDHSVFCFTGTASCFPLVFETNSEYGGRYPFFWWLKGVMKQSETQSTKKDQKYLIDGIADDLNRYQPKLIIINAQVMKIIQENMYENYGISDFDMIKYFSNNKNFCTAWSHYRYLTSIDYYQVYEKIS
jgi:hypothetical protein